MDDQSLGVTTRTVRSIKIMSALKLGAVMGSLGWAVVGAILGVLSVCASGFLIQALSRVGGNGEELFSGGFIGFMIAYVLGLVLFALLGAVAGAVFAWLYNVAAGWVGGIEIEVRG
jgi:hypothetical protein